MCEKCSVKGGGFFGFVREYAGGLISFFLLVAGLVLQGEGASWFKLPYVALVWYLAAFIPVAFPVLKDAWKAFSRKDFFNEFTLMLIASAGAFFIGEYPEAVAVMLFYSVGEALQEKAVRRSKESIRDLLEAKPEYVRVWREGAWVKVSPQEVAAGERVQVAVGERTCIDGRLLSDYALLDTAALTGENVPRRVGTGEEVKAGCVVIDKGIEVETLRIYNDSALAKMARMVEEASRRKAPTEVFLRRVSRVYTPVVMGLALLIFLIPLLWSRLGGNPVNLDACLYRALVFLVISCPCALVVSIPLCYFAGIGKASQNGILFKGGEGLDVAAELKAVAFDKTGTLTSGRFEVENIYVAPGSAATSAEFLPLLASLEAYSRHPLAHAVVRYAARQNISLSRVRDIREYAGMGLGAEIDGKRVLAGSRALMRREGIPVPDLPDFSESVVYGAVDGAFAGCVELSDALKPEAKQALAELRKAGISRFAVFSGDSAVKTETVAKELEIENAFGNLLPEDKIVHLQELRGQGWKTAFVGEGINDAPVLAAADLGVAMGRRGSDVAIETADVVLQTDNLLSLPRAMRIAKSTRRTVWQNIVAVFAFKILIMVLGLTDRASLWAAVFADTGVALLAVLNAVRMMRKKEL